MAYTFGVSDFITALGLSLSDWEPQSYNPVSTYKSGLAVGNRGEVLAETLFDQVTNYQLNLVAKADAISGDSIILGHGYTIVAAGLFFPTQVVLAQPGTDMATLAITGHAHPGVTGTHVSNEFTITLPDAGFGLQGLPASISGGSLADFMSFTHTASVQHTDKTTRAGAFLIGASYQCKIEQTMQMVDQAASISAASGWKFPSDGTNEAIAYKTRSITLHKYQAHD